VELFKKKKFWSAVGGLAVVLLVQFAGMSEAKADKITGVVVALAVGLIGGLAAEDAGKAKAKIENGG